MIHLSIANIQNIHLNAISNGHTYLFKWFVRKNEVKTVIGLSYADTAGICGNLDILRYLHKNQSIWNTFYWSYYTDNAIKNGHLEIVKYAHENEHIDNVSRRYFCNHAADNGHLEILKYLHEHWYPWGHRNI